MTKDLKICDGDLLDQKVEVIVNSWNRNIIPWWLLLPQGVSGAIKRQAGNSPFNELARHGPIPLGGAVETTAGRLPFKAIIHVAGINLLWRSSERSIQLSVRNALKIASEKNYRSIAFPVIGSGTGGLPTKKALAAMQDSIEISPYDGEIRIVRFVPPHKDVQSASLKKGIISEIVVVYTLKSDKRVIEAAQRATKTSLKFGRMRTHGLIGSEKWWQNISSGKLKVHNVSGVITRLGMGGMRDTPEFRMRSDDGEDSNWLRYANSEDLNRYYVVGCRIEVDYVLQRQRLFCSGYWPKLLPSVIEIRLGEQKPVPALKQNSAFPYQAAKGSWASCVIVLFLLMFSAIGAKQILDLVSLLLMLTGLELGVAALFGISKHGRKGIFLPAVIGIILNGLLLFMFLSNFIAARGASR